MLQFLKELLPEKDIAELVELLDFSLNTKIDLSKLQEKIAFANYHHAKLSKIILKLRLVHSDLEVEFDNWISTEIHEVVMEYDGNPELLKTPKDYDRELKRSASYVSNKKMIGKLHMLIKSLESKEKELSSFDWKVKSIIDIHKIQHNIMY